MRVYALVSVVSVFFALACQPDRRLSETELNSVKAVVEDYIQVVLDADWDRAAAYFSDDAVRLPMNAPVERGREAIRQHFTVVDSVPEWIVHSTEVAGSGDLAYARFFFTITAYFGGRAEPFTYTGKQLAVLKRQPDGRWLIITDMWNADAPLGE